MRRGPLTQWLYPVEKGIPGDSGIGSITFEYPFIRYALWGMEFHWMLVFFAVSILSALVLKKPFKTQV